MKKRLSRVHAVVIVLTIVAGTMTLSAGGAAGPTFRDRFPAQADARRDPNVPASNYWALLIGINDYAGRTRDNIGAYEDARDLRSHLLRLGWRGDHIVLLTNRTATASMIIQSIRWLRYKTDGNSVVVFNYSGHQRPTRSSSDGDDESRDQAIHASDNRLILDGVLGKEFNRVRAKKMWINLAVCRARGFTDPGMIKTGRVITFASAESELAYEDPAVRHSVLDWYEINEAMIQGLGDANGDGHVTVEEAYRYARPYVAQRTRGRQHPSMVDKVSGSMYLRPPAPPPPPPPPPPSCTLPVCLDSAMSSRSGV